MKFRQIKQELSRNLKVRLVFKGSYEDFNAKYWKHTSLSRGSRFTRAYGGQVIDYHTGLEYKVDRDYCEDNMYKMEFTYYDLNYMELFQRLFKDGFKCYLVDGHKKIQIDPIKTPSDILNIGIKYGLMDFILALVGQAVDTDMTKEEVLKIMKDYSKLCRKDLSDIVKEYNDKLMIRLKSVMALPFEVSEVDDKSYPIDTKVSVITDSDLEEDDNELY